MLKKILLAAVLFICIIVLYFIAWPVPITPIAFDAPPNPGYTGPFAVNDRLKSIETIPIAGNHGPEDIALDAQGRIYAATHEGNIVRLNSDGSNAENWVNTNGRPLGIDFDSKGNLIVADAYRGLLSINPEGKISELSTIADGIPIRYADDVDIAADFKLLMLTEEIPDDFSVFYNGWDRSGVVSPSGVTIHHPQGDIKMISTYEEPIVSVDYYNTEPNEDGRYWKVNWSETANGHGVTEGGSSGSPLFNSESYLVGTLTGGDASCSFPNGPDYYGKFSYAWESEGSDSIRQLKYWLDPTNSGVLSLKGTNLDSTNVIANFSSDVTEVSIREQIQFFNHSIGNITAYEWNFEGGDPSYSEDENPSAIRYDTFGTYNVKLIASSSNGADSLIREDYIRVLPGLSPNPSNKGIYKLSFGKDVPEDINVEIFDFSGRQISPVFLKKKNDGFYINLSTHAAGMYLIYIRTESSQQLLKAMYTK